ncbi:MAG: bifunctional hydroxymethylpyrimidine kinase/phosphomethylpyrimidine kinase, partial [Lachnospiraceae bacterium]|nr:bifunctional hydroxymethylpyrimidine kinase/phosphomethylpyrimidine kinase [Lachnospiraceae bacterium]
VYRDIMEGLQGSGVRVVVDAAGEPLKNVLEFGPFLIKPNEYELGALFGLGPVNDGDELLRLAEQLRQMGARNVLVSRGAQGAVLLDENGAVHACAAPKGVVKNTVGSGDSMVAGFLAGYEQSGDYREAFRLAVAAGSASAFSEELATAEEIRAVLSRLD